MLTLIFTCFPKLIRNWNHAQCYQKNIFQKEKFYFSWTNFKLGLLLHFNFIPTMLTYHSTFFGNLRIFTNPPLHVAKIAYAATKLFQLFQKYTICLPVRCQFKYFLPLLHFPNPRPILASRLWLSQFLCSLTFLNNNIKNIFFIYIS